MAGEAPRLETERLVLRSLTEQDIDALCELWSEDDVVRFIGGHKLGREDVWRKALAAFQWGLTGFGYWIAEDKASGRIVGQLGLADFKRDMTPSIEGEPELGYVFHPSVHGKGIAGEACRAVVDWADANLPGRSIPAIIDADNAPSIALAERLGFVFAGEADYRGSRINLYRRG